jgi:serine/threonine protein kinase
LGACFQMRPPILLMEYCAGGTLEERLLRAHVKNVYTIPMKTRHRYALELTVAMCFLHRCNPPVVHRDLKPSNVLINGDDRIKVTDFGLSKFIPCKNKTLGDKFVMTGETGSYRYMAPEVFKHEDYNEKVDVYSFALIAYWIITGIRPFHYITDPVAAVKKAALEEERPSLDPLKKMKMTRALLVKMWSHDAETRPSFTEIADIWPNLSVEFIEEEKKWWPSSSCFPTR